MLLLYFQSADSPRLGLKTPHGIIDVAAAHAALHPKHREVWMDNVPLHEASLLAGGQKALSSLMRLEHFIEENHLDGPWLCQEKELTFAPCVLHPPKIICIGLNYHRHALESGADDPTSPVVFSKFSNALAAAGEPIPLPRDGNTCDYEAELAVVIGHRARRVSEADALSYILGYCNANDLSERTWQFRTGQWLLGKTPDKFLPLGPYLVTADAIENPQALQISCRVNGEMRQQSTSADMIFSVAYLISYLSHHMTLEPGDVICTGTPEGVISGMQEKRWLVPGDEVSVEIKGLGILTNVLAAPE